MKGHSLSTWECLQCAEAGEPTTAQTTYTEMAYSGTPICPECGDEMEFQKEVWIEDRKKGIKNDS